MAHCFPYLSTQQVPVTTESIGHPYALQEAYEAARATPPFTRKVNHQGSVMDFIWCRCGH